MPEHLDDLDQRIAEAVWWAANTDDYVRRIEQLKEVWVDYLQHKPQACEED